MRCFKLLLLGHSVLFILDLHLVWVVQDGGTACTLGESFGLTLLRECGGLKVEWICQSWFPGWQKTSLSNAL